MRTAHPLRRRVLGLVGIALIAPIVPAVNATWAAPTGLPAGAAPEIGADGYAVVEQQVSGDMVVEWLEAPPADAARWATMADNARVPAVSSTHDDAEVDGHHHHDHGGGGEDVGVASTAAASQGGGSSSGPAPTPGQGFAVFSTSPRWLLAGYTIRLTGTDPRIEEYRDELVAAAQAASSAGGLPVRVASGRGGSASPARGEITVVIGEGPCGAAIGCGGPRMTSTELVSGRVWIAASALGLDPASRSNLAAHELGHALGLHHYSPSWTDGRQGMYPVISGIPTYRAGDRAGLRFMAGGADKPAGRITGATYAAGHLRIVGTMSSGTKVRGTLGSVSRDATGSAGRFAVTIPAPAGKLRACVTSLDAAAGFRRAIGCTQLSAPGRPFGRIDAVSGSFETIRLTGWAIDPQTAAPIDVQIRRNGRIVTTIEAAAARPDVDAAHAHYGASHGFDLELPAVAGSNELCVRALGVGAGGDRDLGCRRVIHKVDPIGTFELAEPTTQGARVSGWALDPNTPGAVDVRVTVNGVVPPVLGTFRAGGNRPDVARNHPAHGAGHGFSQHLVLTAGDHELCITALNVGLGADRSLGCRKVRVAAPTSSVGLGGSSAGGGPSRSPVVDDVVQTVDGTVGIVGATVLG